MTPLGIDPSLEVTVVSLVKEGGPAFGAVAAFQIYILTVDHPPVGEGAHGGGQRPEHRVVRVRVHAEGGGERQLPAHRHVAAPGEDIAVIHALQREDPLHICHIDVHLHGTMSLCGLTRM